MEIAVIEKIKNLPVQTEESLRDAFSVLMHTEDRSRLTTTCAGFAKRRKRYELRICTSLSSKRTSMRGNIPLTIL